MAAFPGLAIGLGVLLCLAYSHREQFWRDIRARKSSEATPTQAVVHLRTEGVNHRIEAKELHEVDASADAAQIGSIRVRVVSAALEPIGPATTSTRRARPEKRLVVRLRISNAGASQVEHYQGWNSFTRGSGDDRLCLSDELGRTIRPQTETPVGTSKAIKTADIPPGKWIDDFVVFEIPASRPNELRLELPGGAIGSKEKLSFRIPNTMLQNSGDGPPGRVRIK
jgi:hypothetical protein